MADKDELDMPSNRYLQAKKNTAKSRLQTAFDDFKAFLSDKTHPDNQNAVYDKRVKKSIQMLLTSADEMDSISPGEGIFSLIVLSLRSILKVKNQNIILEKKIDDLEKEINRLKKQRIK